LDEKFQIQQKTDEKAFPDVIEKYAAGSISIG